MARIAYDFRFLKGEPDEALCARLADLSHAGWGVVGLVRDADGLICLLRREKNFEVAQSLQDALEEHETLPYAVSEIRIPPEELTG